jgi:hypothetical protein
LTEGKGPFHEAGGTRPPTVPFKASIGVKAEHFSRPLDYDLQKEEGLVRKDDSDEQVNEYYIGLN